MCCRYKAGKYNHSAVWNEVPCVCLHKDSVRRHSLSLHKEATQKELSLQGSSRDGGRGWGCGWAACK